MWVEDGNLDILYQAAARLKEDGRYQEDSVLGVLVEDQEGLEEYQGGLAEYQGGLEAEVSEVLEVLVEDGILGVQC